MINFLHFLRYLPNFKGKLRISRFLIFNKKGSRKFITRSGILFLVPNLEETISFELFVNGVYEKDTIKYICDSIPPNGVFFDVGANIGAICIEVAFARPDISVFAFEASRFIFNYLEVNKAQNNIDNLFLFNLAIHDVNGIEVPFFSPQDQNGKGSFSPIFTKVAEYVQTTRLDFFFDLHKVMPSLIKVDVEGYELLVFKSLSNSNFVTKPILIFEFIDWAEEAASFSPGSAQDYLLSNGYELYNFISGLQVHMPMTKGSSLFIAKA
jgi:FkbM family methyltransferase